MPNSGQATTALATIEQDGTIPECRFANAAALQDFVMRLNKNDEDRSKKRALARGLYDGNPPYKNSALRAAGRAEACNVNWGTGRTYIESAVGGYYDLASEAPGIVAIRTSHGKDTDKDIWSRVMSAQADLLFHDPDTDWDYEMQNSQFEMTVHGRGPFLFEDEYKVFPRSIHDGDLKVPERTPATISRWEVGCVDADYYPGELYDFIRDEEAATQRGYNVEHVKKAIANAMDVQQPTSRAWDWEFYQDQLKQNSTSFVDESKIIPCSHGFWREFDGTITHGIVVRDGMANTRPEYLFFRQHRYDSFNQVIHPMYADRGNGGFHYTVTGLGVKQFGAMVYENRLLCNLMDKAFAPKIFFKFGSTESEQKFTLSTFGDWGRVPAGTDFIQNPIQGMLNDGLAMFRTSSELMRSNLAAYRQTVPMEKQGNPETAKGRMIDAAAQSSLSKTGVNRYYAQLDVLYAEMVRRMCNLNTTDPRAKMYQERCMGKGVPRECFGRIESVRAVRVVGEGSPFLRKQALADMEPFIGRMPEDGQQNWLDDFIASHAGMSAVPRYNPQAREHKPDEQEKDAMLQIAAMKVGVPPVITSEQRPLLFAGLFLKSCVEAIGGVQKGAPPAEVLKYLDLAAPATLAHLKRIAKDPSRKDVFKVLFEKWKKVAAMADKLKKMVGDQAKKQKEQQQKTQAAMSDQALAAAKVKQELALKTAKTKHAMAIKTATTRQGLALADARAASDIRLNHMRAFQE